MKRLLLLAISLMFVFVLSAQSYVDVKMKKLQQGKAKIEKTIQFYQKSEKTWKNMLENESTSEEDKTYISEEITTIQEKIVSLKKETQEIDNEIYRIILRKRGLRVE